MQYLVGTKQKSVEVEEAEEANNVEIMEFVVIPLSEENLAKLEQNGVVINEKLVFETDAEMTDAEMQKQVDGVLDRLRKAEEASGSIGITGQGC